MVAGGQCKKQQHTIYAVYHLVVSLFYTGVSIKYGVAVSGLDELFVSCLVAGGMDNVWSVGKYTTTI